MRKHILSVSLVGVLCAGCETAPGISPQLAASNFIREATRGLDTASEGQFETRVENGTVQAGYYRLVVRPGEENDTVSFADDCRGQLLRLGNSRIKDILFDRKYDLGLAISLPTRLSVGGADADAAERIDVGLFAFRRQSGRCSLDRSALEQRPRIYTPWTAIDHTVADGQIANVALRAWALRQDNPTNVGLLRSAFDALIGLLPGGAAVSDLLANQTTQEMLRQANDRLSALPGPAAAEAPRDLQTFRAIAVAPTDASAGAYRPDSIRLIFPPAAQPDPAVGEQAVTRLSYRVDVEYRGSMLFDSPDFDDPRASDEASYFARLIEGTPPTADRNWLEQFPYLGRLHETRNLDSLQDFCATTIGQITEAGYSVEDAYLLVYATLRSWDHLDPYQIADVDCLSGVSGATALARFGIVLPERRAQLPRTQPDHWPELSDTLAAALKSPRSAEAAGLGRLLDEHIHLDGDWSAFTAADITSEPLSRDGLLDIWTTFENARNSGCTAPRIVTEGDRAAFLFPDGADVPRPGDRAFAQLVRMLSGEVYLMVAGLRGVGSDGKAVIESLWMGRDFFPDDEQLPQIRDEMLRNQSCEPAHWREFVESLPAGPAAAAERAATLQPVGAIEGDGAGQR